MESSSVVVVALGDSVRAAMMGMDFFSGSAESGRTRPPTHAYLYVTARPISNLARASIPIATARMIDESIAAAAREPGGGAANATAARVFRIGRRARRSA